MPKEKGSKICFVIAPIGKDGSDARTRSDQVLNHIINPAAEDLLKHQLRGTERALHSLCMDAGMPPDIFIRRRGRPQFEEKTGRSDQGAFLIVRRGDGGSVSRRQLSALKVGDPFFKPAHALHELVRMAEPCIDWTRPVIECS